MGPPSSAARPGRNAVPGPGAAPSPAGRRKGACGSATAGVPFGSGADPDLAAVHFCFELDAPQGFDRRIRETDAALLVHLVDELALVQQEPVSKAQGPVRPA